MADERIQHTEQMVGAGHGTKTDTLNRLTLVEHNDDGTHKEPLASLNSNFLVEHNSDGTHASSGESYSAGENLIALSSAGQSDSATPVKIGEIEVAKNGTLRITFDLRVNSTVGSPTGYGQLYKNGSVIGTLRSTTSTSAVTFSEDISGIVKGDKIQLYVYIDNTSRDVIASNFKLKNSSYELATVLL